ncbi:nuclear transport factor 2 family protein [Kibdelosporangium aridum]|uniref:Ketosteroid isomerase-related protein n=1 Tax=Kibdelosporangium aridum TaxID=2030 RepID=A0A1W2FYU8_KIBAR|nr:nuclear transport factor 2 family protein [Kibdelosporangium aridum]SMD26892.1 Ketosteroid isomerase-related protein [Kibdelosporangium aridum]
MTETLRETVVRYLRRFEQGDYAGMRAMFTDKATVWNGQGEQAIDDTIEMLRAGAANMQSLRYDIVRQFEQDNEVLQQHVLRIVLNDGNRIDMPVAMYFRFENGLIDRIEEYANFTPPEE